MNRPPIIAAAIGAVALTALYGGFILIAHAVHMLGWYAS